MTDQELKEQLVETVNDLYRTGAITGKGGNVSVRSADRENAVWITPSQIFKGALKPEMMILVNMEGKRMEGNIMPSVESAYHAGIMQTRSDINAVVHTHAPLATIFSMIEMQILPITSEAVMVMDFPKLPFSMAGTRELAKCVIDALGKTKKLGAFLQNHGLVTIGKDLVKAAELTHTAEHVLHMLFTLKSINMTPSLMPENAVSLLQKFSGVI